MDQTCEKFDDLPHNVFWRVALHDVAMVVFVAVVEKQFPVDGL